MRLHELNLDKIDPRLSKAMQKKVSGSNTPPPGHPEHNKNAKTKAKQQQQPQAQPGAGTGPDMQMPQSQIKVTPITMKNYRGGMARSMSGV